MTSQDDNSSTKPRGFEANARGTDLFKTTEEPPIGFHTLIGSDWYLKVIACAYYMHLFLSTAF